MIHNYYFAMQNIVAIVVFFPSYQYFSCGFTNSKSQRV